MKSERKTYALKEVDTLSEWHKWWAHKRVPVDTETEIVFGWVDRRGLFYTNSQCTGYILEKWEYRRRK